MSGKTEPDPQTEGTGTAPNVDAIRTEAAVTAKQEERARFAAVQGCEEYAGRGRSRSTSSVGNRHVGGPDHRER